jgi:hypothetical protein
MQCLRHAVPTACSAYGMQCLRHEVPRIGIGPISPDFQSGALTTFAIGAGCGAGNPSVGEPRDSIYSSVVSEPRGALLPALWVFRDLNSAHRLKRPMHRHQCLKPYLQRRHYRGCPNPHGARALDPTQKTSTWAVLTTGLGRPRHIHVKEIAVDAFRPIISGSGRTRTSGGR